MAIQITTKVLPMRNEIEDGKVVTKGQRVKVSAFIAGHVITRTYNWDTNSKNMHREGVERFVTERNYPTQTLKVQNTLPEGYTFRLF